ncbi:MAG: hypothetical protein EA412_09450 [Chitinophagaceae bacterium]|nr:MAG: hypothetical protein EA412_09450 [Chitinophagaceae bacterium]
MILLVVLFIFLAVGTALYSYLKNKKKRVEETFLKVLPVLHKKNHLFTSLETAIEPYMNDESKILHSVIEMENEIERKTTLNDLISEEAREYLKKDTDKNNKASLSLNEMILLENDLIEYIGRIFEMAEGDVNIHSNTNFSSLEEEWILFSAELEEVKIAFNKVATDYNESVKAFPTSLIAKTFRFKPVITLTGSSWYDRYLEQKK